MVHEDYLSCSAYEGKEAHTETGFTAFYDEASQRYFFAMLDADGKVLLKSEGYPQAAPRENGIQSVIKNRSNRDFYSVKEENGRYFLSLRAANYREIARSCSCDSEAEAMALLPYVTGEKIRTTVVASLAATEGMADRERNSDRREDNYLACREYEGRGDADENGIVKWQHDNGQFYFTWVNADGSTKMRSEGYPTKGARDNGADSVIRNRDMKERYDTKEIGGRYFITLKAGNHQEIARSCPKDSAAAFASWFPILGLGGAAATAASLIADTAVESASSEAATVVESVAEVTEERAIEATAIAEDVAPSAPTAEPEKEDDYLPCKEYAGRNVNDKVNNVALFKHDNGQYYFAIYNVDGSVRLRSEGFGSAQDRDVELSGVLKNLNNPDMYSTIRRGEYYIQVLKDKTGREVGRSCLQKDAPAPVVAPVAAAATTVAAAATAAAPANVVVEDVEDDYLPCKEYQGRSVNDKVNNVALFKHDNGQYYFAIYHADGSVRLRSEGFRTSQERDGELSGALRNLNNADMYTIIRRGEYYITVLKDKTGREVGRSCLSKEEPKITVATAATAATAVAATAIAATAPAAATVADVEDDYLPCKEYHGHTTSPRKGFTTFKSERTGKYYFAVVDEDGDVSFRSEGHPTEAERDADMADVVRNLFNKERYEVKQVGLSHHFIVLRDEKGKEIARSCAYADKAAAAAAAPFLFPSVKAAAPIVAAVAAAAAAPIVKEAIKVKEEIKVEKVAAAPIVETAVPIVTAAEEVAAASSGFNWWWLLLPALALLAWLLAGKGCNKPEAAAPAVTAAPVVVDTVKTVAPAVTAPATCPACASSTDPIFTSVCDNPKKLSRLGTNPEFGNSHALSPTEFYDKLKKAHANNDVDKEFLDRIFKGMGYTGFADAKADMFSAVVLPVGTTGKLGYSKQHKTGCYTLPDDEYHRKAFHIKAANGCDFHFMKTCGNHFFFCK